MNSDSTAQETNASILLPDKDVVEECDPFADIVPMVKEKTSERQMEVKRSTALSSSPSPRSPKEASESRNKILVAKPSTRRPSAPLRSSEERARPTQATVGNVSSKQISEKKSRYSGHQSSSPGKQRPTTKPALLGKVLATSSRLSTTADISPSTLPSTHHSTKKSPPVGKQGSNTSVNFHASSTPLTSTTQKPKTTLSNEELDRKFKRELLRRMEEILTVLLEVKEKQNRMYADHCEKAIVSVDSDSNPPVTFESEWKEFNTAISKGKKGEKN